MMKMKNKLPETEQLDFSYLLELLPPLYGVTEYALLPELFSIIGHENLLKLCKYAGGETLKIPTLEELSVSLSALQYFYDVYIMKTQEEPMIPNDLKDMVQKIKDVYDNA